MADPTLFELGRMAVLDLLKEICKKDEDYYFTNDAPGHMSVWYSHHCRGGAYQVAFTIFDTTWPTGRKCEIVLKSCNEDQSVINFNEPGFASLKKRIALIIDQMKKQQNRQKWVYADSD